VGTGDGGDAVTSQELTSLSGKVLRINSNGSIPKDNPFAGALKGKYGAIWAYGVRNAFSMAYDLVTNRLVANDVGYSSYEEVNEVLPGTNYGWPVTEGPEGPTAQWSNYKAPLYYYDHTKGCSIVGSAFYRPKVMSFPEVYAGKLFFMDYCNGALHVLDPDKGHVVDTLITGLDRPVALAVSPEGELYYAQRAGAWGYNTSTAEGSLWKIVYAPDATPKIIRNPVSTTVTEGEGVQFEVVTSGAAPFTYAWSVNGREVALGTTPTLELKDVPLDMDGTQVVCLVTNENGSVSTVPAILNVKTNSRPDVHILSPSDGYTYKGGDVLAFSGVATDPEDGPLDASHLTWEIVFHHDDHVHPAMPALRGVTEGTYAIPKAGETSHNVWYRIYLTATDSQGFTQRTYKDYHPQVVLVRLQSDPPNVPVRLEGKLVETPFVFPAVAGTTRVAEAVTSTRSGPEQLLIFGQWSTGTNTARIRFEVPDSSHTYTVQYQSIPPGNGNGLSGKYYRSREDFDNDRPMFIRKDKAVHFDWMQETAVPGLGANPLYMRWEGLIEPYHTDAYTFSVTPGGSAQLWVDQQQVIEQQAGSRPEVPEGTIVLEAGRKYPVRLEYAKEDAAQALALTWKSTLLHPEIIPQSQLFTTGILSTESTRSKLLPNPFTGQAKIMLKDHSGEVHLKLQDVQGRTVAERRGIAGSAESIIGLEVEENIRLGLYFLHIQSREKKEVLRVVKQ
jgi:hypothetical protein